MARGHSRNEAQNQAIDERNDRRSYAEAMGIMDASRVVLPQITETLAGMFAELSRVIAAVAEGFVAAGEAFLSAYNQAMQGFN